MDLQNKARRIGELLLGADKILILTHKNPDGDAVGSSIALSYCLASLGKYVENVNIDGVPEALLWLEGAELVKNLPTPGVKFDLMTLLDCNELSRTGFEPSLVEDIPLKMVIDHHPSTLASSDEILIAPKVASSGQLVYRVIRALGAEITPSVAQDIYVAIHTDTGGFRFPNTDVDAMETATEMVRLGAVPAHVSVMLNEREQAGRLRLLGLSLGTLTVTPCGRAATIAVTLDMLEKTGTSAEHTDGFVNYPRSIEGVEVAIILKETSPGVWRVGLRSRGLLDVNAIAREYGGGGHRNASGATIPGTLEEVTDLLISKAVRGLDELMAI